MLLISAGSGLIIPPMVLAQNVTIEPSREDAKPSILGSLSDGSQAPPQPTPEAPEFEIFWSQEHEQGGRIIIVNEVVAPVFPKIEKSETAVLTEQEPAELIKLNSPEGVSDFFVSATIYGNRGTHIRCSSFQDGQQRMTECWSNVNWNHLGGMTSFRARGQNFTYLLAHGNSSLKALRQMRRDNLGIKAPRVPKELPRLEESEPLYFVVSGEDNEEVMDFIEAIHDLYAAKRRTLKRAYRKREKARLARLEELRLNPSQLKDIEITFWNNNVNK